MASAIKRELSLKERLAQALVPENEQPYELPENWIWTRLGIIVTSAVEKDNDFSSDTEKKYIGLEHIEKNIGIVSYGSSSDIKSLKNVFKKGNILYGKLRPYLNKHDIVNFDGICSTDILVFKSTPIANIKLVNYFLNTSKFIEYAVFNSKGINLPRVSQDTILNAIYPLPPLDEQQRIVERIENLFEKLDRAKELAQSALDSYETRKAAILHKAFTGELTAKWRKENNLDLQSWEENRLDSIAVAIDPQPSHRTPPSVENGIPYIGIAECNYETNQVDWDKARKVSHLVLEEHLERYLLSDGDFIIGKIGTIGKPFIIPSKQDYTLSANVVLIQSLPEKVNPKFLYYSFQTGNVKDQMDMGQKATTQAAFGIQKVRALIILIPTFSEQLEIVHILDGIFENEQRAKELCDTIEKIDLMKKAILARAFRGELGTNDPTEESAKELLKEVLQP